MVCRVNHAAKRILAAPITKNFTTLNLYLLHMHEDLVLRIPAVQEDQQDLISSTGRDAYLHDFVFSKDDSLIIAVLHNAQLLAYCSRSGQQILIRSTELY